ncbi:MAG: biotin/lipoyl-containing protein, partial [Polynucleobacter sp.]
MTKQLILVPDIGDYDDVPVIEVLVKVGDRIEKEQPLLVLESDKATMEVPADAAGTIISIAVKVDDKVKKGTVIAEIELEAGAASQPTAPAAATVSAATAQAPAPQAPAAPISVSNAANAFQGKVDHECDLLVLGAGPG